MRSCFDATLVFLRSPDRHDDDFDRRQQWRYAQAIVVAVGHHQSADQTRGHSPARVPGEVHTAGFRLEFQIERFGEVLTEVVRRSCLQRLVVLHHAFARVGSQRAGESLRVCLQPSDHGHRHPAFHEVAINAEHAPSFFLCLVVGCMGGVAFLPEELERAQEESRAHLPTHNVRPLIDQHRQIAIALDPLGVHRVDDRLRCRTDNQWLFQLFAAAVGDDSSLRRKSLYVLGFLVQEAFGDEEREVRVLMTRVFEHCVELVLHPLPDPVAARPDYHAAADGRVIGKLSAQHHFVVPRTEVFGAFCQFLVVGHCGR